RVGKPSGHAYRRQPARWAVAGRGAATGARQTRRRDVDKRTHPRTRRLTNVGNTLAGLAIWAADVVEESGLFVDCGTRAGVGDWGEPRDLQCGECDSAAPAALRGAGTVGANLRSECATELYPLRLFAGEFRRPPRPTNRLRAGGGLPAPRC